VVNLAGEAVRRQPFGDGVGFQECSIEFFWRRAKHAMKSDCVGHFILLKKNGEPLIPDV
jgi:hypothetical protein